MVAIRQEGSGRSIFDFKIVPKEWNLIAMNSKTKYEPEQLTPLSFFVMPSFIENYSLCGLELFYVQFYKMLCMQTLHCAHCTSHLKLILPLCV